MKKVILASACILALSVGGAFAQTQPAPGASTHGNVGAGATKPSATKHVKKGMTTGMGSGARSSKKGMTSNPSSEGIVGAGTSSKASKQPEGR
jgi:hypothetical protein